MNIRRLDEEKATLRLILILAYDMVPLTRLEFIEKAEEELVGRTAFYSSLRALKELGFIEETQDTKEGKRVIHTELTEKGIAVARLIWDIENLLGDE
jgi:DNA-binding PadR family transcriptional regulator